MLKIVIVVFCLCVAMPLCAQQMSDEYERIFSEYEEAADATPDKHFLSSSFYRSSSLFDRLSRNGFNFISYRNRGYDPVYSTHFIHNLDLSPATDKYPDYQLYSALKFSSTGIVRYSCSGARIPGGGFGGVSYAIVPSQVRPGIRLRADYSERYYRGGGTLSAAGDLGKRWSVVLNARYHAGHDKFIDGVFSESGAGSASLQKIFSRDARLTLSAMASSSLRGTRSWTVGELYTLTGDNYYNPAWGWFGGRRRSANVRDDNNGLLAVSYEDKFRSADILLSVMYVRSERARSHILWHNSVSPMPDHYINLPGYYSDPSTVDDLSHMWMSGEGVRQIDWERIWNINSNDAGRSVYIIGEDVGVRNAVQAALSAVSRISGISRLSYGGRFSKEGNNYFRRAKDMLGGDYFYGGGHNTQSEDGIMVGEGDRFAYDFDVPRMSASAYAAWHLSKDKWSAGMDAGLSYISLGRRGNDDYIGNDTPEGSGRADFTTYSFRLSASGPFLSRHTVSAAVWAGERAPAYQDVFLDAELNGVVCQDAGNIFSAGAEIKYAGAVSSAVTLELSAYYTRTARETQIYRYYDNVLPGHMIVSMQNMGKRFAGVEASAEADITQRFSVAGAISFNDYRYATDATASFYRREDMELLMENDRCRIKDLVCSPSPQTLFSVSARYSIPGSWDFELSFVYGSCRYVSLNPVRRTGRITGMASSPETADDFLRQERLPAASVANLYISRRLKLFGSHVYAGLTINNLLGKKDILYGGYEQMQINSSGTGVNRRYSPLPSRYAYCYPRSVHVTVSINF